jgi:hypothetical protein
MPVSVAFRLMYSHANPLPGRPGMRMIGDIENTLGHLPALPHANDPFETTFKNFDRVIIHGDRSCNL